MKKFRQRGLAAGTFGLCENADFYFQMILFFIVSKYFSKLSFS
jgi:hypothetical protein